MDSLDMKQTVCPKKSLLYWVKIICISMLVCCYMTFNEASGVLTVFYNSTKGGIWVNTFAFVGLFLLLNKVYEYCHMIKCGVIQTLIQVVLSVFFSLFSILSIYFENNTAEKVNTLFASNFSILSVGLAFIGGLVFFYILFRFLWCFCINKSDASGNTALSRFFGKHLYRNCFFVLIIAWLPQYIARFPGVITFDGWHSLAMYIGDTEITTQHPLIWLVLIGKLTDLGLKIGIGWLAPLVICFVQHIFALFVVSYTVSTIKKIGLPLSFVLGVLVFYAVLPPISYYASTVYNDYIYSLAIQLLTIELAYYLFKRKTYFSKHRHFILTAIAVFCTIVRYNGLYTMAVIIVVVCAREITLLIKAKAKLLHSAVIVLCLILPLMGGQTVQFTLNHIYNAQNISSRAMLAMPIQQTVRCLIEHGDDIPEEDYSAIHTVLTWSNEEYAASYNPRNFDSVKPSFKLDATKEELLDFVKAWTHLVARYPDTCFMATANQTYYLFSPLVENTRYYRRLDQHQRPVEDMFNFDASPYLVHFSILDSINYFVYAIQKHYYHAIPIIGLTGSQAVYTILLFAFSLRLLFNKDRRALVLAVMPLVTLAITIIGPAVYNHPRYTFPIMFSMPVLMAGYAITNRPAKKSSAKR